MQTHNSDNTTRDHLFYLASLPERLPRALAAGLGGLLYESSLVLLPGWTRRTQLYQSLLGRVLRITVEWAGGVRGVIPSDAISADRLTTRKAAGNVVEFTSIFTIGWSPLWLLAAAADLTGGAKVYLVTLTSELKRMKLLPPDQEFTTVDGLLAALSDTSSVLARAIDIPPLAQEELAASLLEMQESWQTLRSSTSSLPGAERLNAVAQEMQQTAARENISLWMVSALLGLGAFQAGARLGQVYLYDCYRQSLGELREKGAAAYISRVSKPYLAQAAAHLDPEIISYTEFILKRVRTLSYPE